MHGAGMTEVCNDANDWHASLPLRLAATVVTAIRSGADELNDYPSAARADYVFACMKTNGETR